MDFDRLCQIFTMQEPYYGILLSAMNRFPTKAVPTIGVAKSGNVFKLGYNPDWLEKWDENSILELLKHETLHLAFNHFTIWDTDKSRESPAVNHLRNIAEDLEVNCYLKRGNLDKAIGGCWCEDFGFEKNLGAREYFRLLTQKKEQMQQQQQKGSPEDKPCNGGQSDDEQEDNEQQERQNNAQPTLGEQKEQEDEESQQGQSQGSSAKDDEDDLPEAMRQLAQSFDDHSMWPDEESEAERQQMKDVIDQLLDFAAVEVEKACGELPGEMRQRIEQIRKKPRPVTDWKRYFRRYMGNSYSEAIRKSKKRQSRRFPDAAGNRHRRKSNILVAIDTSGSINMRDYQEFFGQIKTLTQQADFHVIECDCVIEHEYDFNGVINDKPRGGGGTSFQPVVNYFHEHQKQYDALVYFTDGYADIPKNTPKETLWVISSDGSKDPKRYRVNGASVVFIPSKSK